MRRPYAHVKAFGRRSFLIALTSVALMLSAGSAGAEESRNLVKNPGFEETDKATQLPLHWQVIDWSGKEKPATPKLEVSADAHTGKVTVQIRRLGEGRNILLQPQLQKGIEGEHTFRLAFHYKGGAEEYIYASMYTTTPDGKKLQYLHSKHFPVAKDWTEAVFEFTTDPATKSLLVWVRVAADGFLVDDVSLEEITATETKEK